MSNSRNTSPSNCYNCGRTVYGISEANAGGHVFCCRKCRTAWERDQARQRAIKAAAERRAAEAKRIREANLRIDAENARRRAEQRRLDCEADVRDGKFYTGAFIVAGIIVLLAISRTAAVIATGLVLSWLGRKWIVARRGT